MSLDAEISRLSLNPLPDEWAERLLPTRTDSKAMCHKDGLIRQYTRAELAYWCGRHCGFGMKVGNGLMCADIDQADFRAEAMERFGLDSCLVVRTMRGFHLWMRTLLTDQRTIIKWRGLPIDFKFTGYMMWPPTVVNGFRYSLEAGLPSISELPLFPAELLMETKSAVGLHHAGQCQPIRPDATLALYAERTPASVQGAGGSRACIVACLKFLTMTNGDEAKAFEMACWWNRLCEPPWDTEKEEGADSLKRKLREAARMWKAK